MIDFNIMIDRYLYKEYKQKEIGRYYPSEIGSCMRKIWFSYKIPKETPKELLKIFEAGNILHDFVVRVLKSEKNPEVELLQSELPFELAVDDFTISGRVDDLLLLKEMEKQILVEVKSCKSLFYIDRPLNHNVSQLQFYMWALGVHNGILLYVEKNTLNSKVFTIKYNEEAGKQILERFKKLHKHLKDDTIPEAEAKQDQETIWMCRWCDWKEECDKYKEEQRF